MKPSLFVPLKNSSLPFRCHLKPTLFLFEAVIASSRQTYGLIPPHTSLLLWPFPSTLSTVESKLSEVLVLTSVDPEVPLASVLSRAHLGNVFNSWLLLSNIDESEHRGKKRPYSHYHMSFHFCSYKMGIIISGTFIKLQ